MHLWHNSRYWQDFTELWKGFPDREMDGLFKWYYLVQFAFWLQQILVVNIEERRKDYYQMFTHHILTCALIFSSYAFYCTKVGNVILCIMDIVDITLPVAKILKYLGYHLACDIAFGFFMVTWVAARHVMYLIVCWSLYKDMSVYIPYGCYQANTGERLSPSSASKGGFTNLMQSFNDPEGQVCFSRRIKWMFLSMLLLLQVLTLMWFGMIVRVAWRVINGGAAEDSRSDGEEDEGEHHDHCADEHVLDGQVYEVDEVITVAPPLEEEVGVEAINLKGRNSPTRRFRKSGGSAASGVSLPGHHSDRKELLGRIGCDKGA
ncbi:MAG: hypothetical protein M1819_004486 [Sarea resinae]|nr:MAG: hypothetical protein M1819_004486 [Sarea resinae]